MRRRTLIGMLVLVLCSFGLISPALAVNVPSCGGEIALFARDAILMEPGPTLIDGNVVVNSPTGRLDVGARNVITGTATAHEIHLATLSQIGRCEYDVLSGLPNPTVCQQVETPIDPPLPCLPDYPPIQPPAVDACVDSAPDVIVAANETRVLAPGCYGDVRVNIGGTLQLNGEYQFRMIRLRRNSSLLGPATTNVKMQLITEPSVTISDINFNTPRSGTFNVISIGRNSTVINSTLNGPFARSHLFGGADFISSEVISTLITVEPITVTPPLPGGAFKRGVKFNDRNGNGMRDPEDEGLPNWTIRAFDPTGVLVAETTTGADGSYTLNLLQGRYLICEVLKPNWTQTFPASLGPIDSDDSIEACPDGMGLGQRGYFITLDAGETDEGNDFGNTLETPFCPEDPNAVCSIIIGAGGFSTVQAAYDSASDGDVLCMFSNTTENVVLNGDKSLTITQCTTAKVTAADSSLPVWTISSTGNLTIIGPDSQGGTVGWLVQSDGHDIRGVRASNASQAGILITGSNNKVSFNSVTGSPVGVSIQGDDNDVRGGTASHNGTGIEVGATASGNTVRTARVENNSSTGISVSGPDNTLDGNRVSGNGGDGILVNASATDTGLKSNQSGSPENGGAEYQLNVDAVNLGGNRADGVSIPSAGKCPTFPAAGTCE